MQGRILWFSKNVEHNRRFFYLRRIFLVLTFFILTAGSTGIGMFVKHQLASANPAATVYPAIGINLAWSGDSNGDFLFADAFKTWRLEPAPGQSNAPSVDANGWPQGDFSAFLWDGAFLPHTTGTYAIHFNGKASLSLSLVGGLISNQSYDAGTNTTTATVRIDGDSSPSLNFTNTQRTNNSATNTGVTNVQLMRPVSPGSSTSYSFNTAFTDAIKNFLTRFQAIRFMDTTGTNGSTESAWSDRTLPQNSQQGRASWEYIIQLCNETGKDGYINIPELATDDYVTKLANLIKYGSDANGNIYSSVQSNPVHPPLNANIHLYIENSNEVWNGGFQQMHQNHDAAVAEVNAGGSPLNYDGETNEWSWAWRRIALRIKQISDIFRSVFGDSAMPPNSNARFRPLLEWQYGNAQDTANTGLAFLNNYYNNANGNHVSNPHPVNYFLYGGGGAAYSGVKDAGASTIDGMYNSGLDDGVVNGTVVSDVTFTSTYGLHDVAYEGGFEIGGDYLSSLQKQANVDPRAKNMEIQAQTLFTQNGGELLMYFDSTSSNYGLAQPTVLDSTPKLQAIDAINQNGVNVSSTSTPTPTPTLTTGGSTSFSTGFESGNSQPTWNDAVDNSGFPAGNINNVVGICCGLTGPEAGTRSETTHQGNIALMYSGSDSSSSTSYAYMKVFDLSSSNVVVGSGTTLDYWIYPQDSSANGLVGGNNSTCVAIDLIFSNGTNLRDSGAVDQNGNRAHPAYQCNHLTTNSWNHVVVNLGTHSNGLQIIRIDFGYDQPGNTGGYRGYIDDISIHN